MLKFFFLFKVLAGCLLGACAGFVPIYILSLSFYSFFAAPRRVDYDGDDEAEWSDNSRGR